MVIRILVPFIFGLWKVIFVHFFEDGTKLKNSSEITLSLKPVVVCVPYQIWVPHQERHHKQKCLFGKDKPSLPTGPLNGLQPGQSPNEVIRPISGPSLKHQNHQTHH